MPGFQPSPNSFLTPAQETSLEPIRAIASTFQAKASGSEEGVTLSLVGSTYNFVSFLGGEIRRVEKHRRTPYKHGDDLPTLIDSTQAEVRDVIAHNLIRTIMADTIITATGTAEARDDPVETARGYNLGESVVTDTAKQNAGLLLLNTLLVTDPPPVTGRGEPAWRVAQAAHYRQPKFSAPVVINEYDVDRFDELQGRVIRFAYGAPEPKLPFRASRSKAVNMTRLVAYSLKRLPKLGAIREDNTLEIIQGVHESTNVVTSVMEITDEEVAFVMKHVLKMAKYINHAKKLDRQLTQDPLAHSLTYLTDNIATDDVATGKAKFHKAVRGVAKRITRQRSQTER